MGVLARIPLLNGLHTFDHASIMKVVGIALTQVAKSTQTSDKIYGVSTGLLQAIVQRLFTLICAMHVQARYSR